MLKSITDKIKSWYESWESTEDIQTKLWAVKKKLYETIENPFAEESLLILDFLGEMVNGDVKEFLKILENDDSNIMISNLFWLQKNVADGDNDKFYKLLKSEYVWSFETKTNMEKTQRFWENISDNDYDKFIELLDNDDINWVVSDWIYENITWFRENPFGKDANKFLEIIKNKNVKMIIENWKIENIIAFWKNIANEKPDKFFELMEIEYIERSMEKWKNKNIERLWNETKNIKFKEIIKLLEYKECIRIIIEWELENMVRFMENITDNNITKFINLIQDSDNNTSSIICKWKIENIKRFFEKFANKKSDKFLELIKHNYVKQFLEERKLENMLLFLEWTNDVLKDFEKISKKKRLGSVIERWQINNIIWFLKNITDGDLEGLNNEQISLIINYWRHEQLSDIDKEELKKNINNNEESKKYIINNLLKYKGNCKNTKIMKITKKMNNCDKNEIIQGSILNWKSNKFIIIKDLAWKKLWHIKLIDIKTFLSYVEIKDKNWENILEKWWIYSISDWFKFLWKGYDYTKDTELKENIESLNEDDYLCATLKSIKLWYLRKVWYIWWWNHKGKRNQFTLIDDFVNTLDDKNWVDITRLMEEHNY